VANHARPRSTNPRNVVLGVVIFLLVATTGGMLWSSSTHAQRALTIIKRRTSTTTTIPTTVVPTTTVESSPFSSSLESYLNDRSESAIDASVLDLNTGKVFDFHVGSQYPQPEASVVKLDILGTLLAQSNGTVPSNLQPTMQAMIEQSDNASATSLWNEVGGQPAIYSFNQMIGMSATQMSTCVECPGFPWPGWGLSTTTAADQIKLLAVLTQPNQFLNTTQRQYVVGLLENVTSSEAWGVSSGPPSGVTVALKNGWLPLTGDTNWQVNSVGWIFGQGKNYLIAVLTSGNATMQYGIDTIQAISEQVWNSIPAS
jgi:Beta-lactamase enzyme family